jgi:hypothetical protein
VVAATLSLGGAGCRQRVDPNALSGDAACAALDSVLVSAGPARPYSMSGDAVVDVEQFRFRGHFRLDASADGDAVIELGGSTLFGGHREDVVVSLVDDTLRVFDRERGHFYEGEDLDALIWDATRARADWARVVGEMLASPTRCDPIDALTRDEDGVRGRNQRGSFRLVVESGRLSRATWPNPIHDATFDDKLDVRYLWQRTRLSEVTGSLPARGWRVRLTDTE